TIVLRFEQHLGKIVGVTQDVDFLVGESLPKNALDGLEFGSDIDRLPVRPADGIADYLIEIDWLVAEYQPIDRVIFGLEYGFGAELLSHGVIHPYLAQIRKSIRHHVVLARLAVDADHLHR